MRSLTELGLHPNLSAVVLHRLSADRQADPRTLVLPSTVKPLEGLEDLVIMHLTQNSAAWYPSGA